MLNVVCTAHPIAGSADLAWQAEISCTAHTRGCCLQTPRRKSGAYLFNGAGLHHLQQR